jgi:hypothetical protein
MKKKGKTFVRRIDPAAGFRAVAMNHGIDSTQQADLGVALRVSLELLRTGKAAEQEFHTLAACINVSLVLAERGIGEDHMQIVKLAQDGLLRLLMRGKQTGRWLLDGPAYAAIRDGVELHEGQLAAVSRREAADAMREVMRRIDRGDVFSEQRKAA